MDEQWMEVGWREDGDQDAGIWNSFPPFLYPGIRRGRIPGQPPLTPISNVSLLFSLLQLLFPRSFQRKWWDTMETTRYCRNLGRKKRQEKCRKKDRKKATQAPSLSPGNHPRGRLDLGRKKPVWVELILDKNSELLPFPNTSSTSSPDSQSWEFREKPLGGIKPQEKWWRRWDTPRDVSVDGDAPLVQPNPVEFSHSESQDKEPTAGNSRSLKTPGKAPKLFNSLFN